MGKVKFSRLTRKQYEALSSPDADTVYFLTDCASLMMGGHEYTHVEKQAKFLVDRTYADDTYGTVAWLDSDNSMKLSGYYADGVSTVDLWVVSANPSITGNAVLTLNDIAFLVPVGATPAKVTLSLGTSATGRLTIARNTASSSDTLKSGSEAVTVLVVDWRCS